MGMSVKEAERILREAGIQTDVPAGQKLTITQGDVVRVNIAFGYRGPAQSVTPYASIGKKALGIFDEIAYASGPKINLSQSTTFLSYTGYVDINSSNCKPEANHDVYAKLLEYTAQLMEILDVIDVVGAVEFQNFAITGYDKV